MAFQIALVGLGTVGTSIGLALKSTAAELEIVGHDKDDAASRRASSLKAVDRTEWNLIAACERADLVVLSIPLDEIRDTLAALGPELKEGAIVTDTAPLKVAVIRWADETLPTAVQFVGGHPILRKQGATPAADLLAGATYCLTPHPGASAEAVEAVSNLAEASGARAFYLDALEHDGLIAALDQLPQMASLAFQRVLGRAPSRSEIRRLAGFRHDSLVQLLDENAALQTLQYGMNADHLARCMREMSQELAALSDALEQDSESLAKAMESARTFRNEMKAEDEANQDRRSVLGRFFSSR